LPHRWDIVVFKSVQPHAEHDTLVKRVVALPGEHVMIQNGKIYINGKPLELPDSMPNIYYTAPASIGGLYGAPGADEAHSIVPPGHVFVLGDNSANSYDARAWGWVPDYHLVGRATSIWWPVTRWRDFTGFSHSWWWIGGWVLFGVWLFTRLLIGRSWRVRDDWLSPLLRKGQHLFIRFSLGVPVPITRIRLTRGRALQRGDVVLFRPPTESGSAPEYVLGVIAGLPGERVFLNQGKVEINDAPVASPAWLGELEFSRDGVDGKYCRSKGKEFSLVADKGYCILVDGDFRQWDSRTVGWISRKEILGHATTVWWPLGARKRLKASTPDVR
jgi:signal peptidase I